MPRTNVNTSPAHTPNIPTPLYQSSAEIPAGTAPATPPAVLPERTVQLDAATTARVPPQSQAQELPDLRQRDVQPASPETSAPRSTNPATEPAAAPSDIAPPATHVDATEASAPPAAAAAPDDRRSNLVLLMKTGRFPEALRIAQQAADNGEHEFFAQNFGTLATLVGKTYERMYYLQNAGTLRNANVETLRLLLSVNANLRQAEAAMGAGIQGNNARAELLTPQNENILRNSIRMLEPRPGTVELADSDEPIHCDVGDIRQLRPNACGDACVQAILRYQGRQHLEFGTNDRPVTKGKTHHEQRDDLREQGIGTEFLTPSTPNAVSARELRHWLAHHGPLLARSEDHSVLITGIEGDRVTIHCPLLGKRTGSLEALNRYLCWDDDGSPIMASYAIEAPSVPFVPKEKPGLFMRLGASLYVARAERAATPDWTVEKS